MRTITDPGGNTTPPGRSTPTTGRRLVGDRPERCDHGVRLRRRRQPDRASPTPTATPGPRPTTRSIELTSLTDAVGRQLHQVTYDAAGNVISVTDRNGQTITYTYDAESRLALQDRPRRRHHDVHVRPVRSADRGRERRGAARVHVRRRRPRADRDQHADDARRAADVDVHLHLRRRRQRHVGRRAPAGRPATATTQARAHDAHRSRRRAFSLGYDAAGRQTSMTRPNGVDRHQRRTTRRATSPPCARRSARRSSTRPTTPTTPRAGGRRSPPRRAPRPTPTTAHRSSRPATQPAGSGLANEQYTYDPVGNRTRARTRRSAPSPTTAATDSSSDVRRPYTYDDEGNLLSRTDKATGARPHTAWTAEHQLVGITYPDGSTSTFRYDPVGRRVEIGDGAATSRYAYDRGAIAAEYDGANALVATYVHDPKSPTHVLEMTRSGQRYFYLTDAQGSTTALTTHQRSDRQHLQLRRLRNVSSDRKRCQPLHLHRPALPPGLGPFLFPMRAYDPLWVGS